LTIIFRTLEVSRAWFYYRRRQVGKLRIDRRPEVEGAVRQILREVPGTYGYRRIHALLIERGIQCDGKTVYRVLRRRNLLSSVRKYVARPGRLHEGQVAVESPNRRWASDMTQIKAWNGEKLRLATLIDCADRSIVAWKLAKRIGSEELCEMVREAVYLRFGEDRSQIRGIEFLSDNGPEYASHILRNFLEKMGMVPCRTPCRSPESNGIAEAFFGSFKRDYVYQNQIETAEDIKKQVPGWIRHYNEVAPHSALKMRSPARFYAEWKEKLTKKVVQI
jgi:putative transposase